MTVNFHTPPGDQDVGREGKRWIVVECMECGEWDTSVALLRGRKTCPGRDDRTHGPTCSVEVAPVSELEREKELHYDIRVRADDLLERLQEAEAKLERAHEIEKQQAELLREESERANRAEERLDEVAAEGCDECEAKREAAEARHDALKAERDRLEIRAGQDEKRALELRGDLEALRGGVEAVAKKCRETGPIPGFESDASAEGERVANEIADDLTALLDQKGEPSTYTHSQDLQVGDEPRCPNAHVYIDGVKQPCPDCTTGKQELEANALDNMGSVSNTETRKPSEVGVGAGDGPCQGGDALSASVDSSLNADLRARAEDEKDVRLEQAESALTEIRDTPVTGSDAEWVAWAREVAAVVLPADSNLNQGGDAADARVDHVRENASVARAAVDGGGGPETSELDERTWLLYCEYEGDGPDGWQEGWNFDAHGPRISPPDEWVRVMPVAEHERRLAEAAPQSSHVEGDDDLAAISKAAEDISLIYDAGLEEWAELLLALREDGWTLSRSTQQIDIQGLEKRLEAEEGTAWIDMRNTTGGPPAARYLLGLHHAYKHALELVRERLSDNETEEAKRDFMAYGEGSGPGIGPGSDEL